MPIKGVGCPVKGLQWRLFTVSGSIAFIYKQFVHLLKHRLLQIEKKMKKDCFPVLEQDICCKTVQNVGPKVDSSATFIERLPMSNFH